MHVRLLVKHVGLRGKEEGCNEGEEATRRGLQRVSENLTQYGFSLLHAYIRFMECVLHISYRLNFEKWRVTGKNQEIMKQRKAEIQKDLRDALGIMVDTPKQGFGSTNDGNTARTVFKSENIAIVSEKTGFDKELLKRLSNILSVLHCGHSIRIEEFRIYGLETAREFVRLYPWYCMPPSMHIILLHGYLVLKKFDLPIYMMSEEAQETRNKDIKRFREFHSRKKSRVCTNQDVFERLLTSSDIYISETRDIPEKQHRTLTDEMNVLLY
ncbi:uncharacterized protein LOC122502016 [Leptopilina heterotoma]|uniref:uncharacterized protein LOC122502016 n=1 Tax=Leptopilina heterotoma TaxID=63436 RepID=UPI001CA899D6|nr:uncharacterized protein LOC122502016 [Leptopilina heterotoma]